MNTKRPNEERRVSSDDETDASQSLFLLAKDRKKSFLAPSTKKKLRRRNKKWQQDFPLRNIETSVAISTADIGQTSGRTEGNTAQPTFPSLLASFNALMNVRSAGTHNGSRQSPHGIESHVPLTAHSVGRAAGTRELMQTVSQILCEKLR